MHKSATKCNETIGKWCKNKHGASKIIDTFETCHRPRSTIAPSAPSNKSVIPHIIFSTHTQGLRLKNYSTHTRGLRLKNYSTHTRGLRLKNDSNHTRGLRLKNDSTHTRGLRPSTYARGLRPSSYAGGLRLSTYARGLLPLTYALGLRLLTAQFNKDMQDYTPSAEDNTLTNFAEAHTKNIQYLHMRPSQCTTASQFAL
jgi:hypothetical protein